MRTRRARNSADNHVFVLSSVGCAVKAPFDLHKLPARDGIGKLAVMDTARNNGSRRDKSVVLNCYGADNVCVATSELPCYKLDVTVAWFGTDGE